MQFKLRNFGKITEADIKLDGITVICGNNNTGKSTVGKALFAYFNALNDYKNKINTQKCNKLRTIILNYSSRILELPRNILFEQDPIEFISEHNGLFSQDEIKDYLEENNSIKLPKEKIEELVNYLNMSPIDILEEYVYRYISSVMNGQVKNSHSAHSSKCIIAGEFKEFTNTITLKKHSCICKINDAIEHSAYYINTPFTLDYLNESRVMRLGNNPMNRSVIEAIQKAQTAIDEDSMTNILDSVLNKKDLDDIRTVIKKVYTGDTVIDHGRYFYNENGESYDFRNISTGLKSFALIERMLETGALKRKDILILDEPEIHLHSEWQIYYAELIVLLQKKFDLTILLVTHSFQFLEALDFYMKKYEILEKSNFYIPENVEKGIIMKYCGNDSINLKKILTTGSITLSNLKFEYEMENNNIEEDNE